MTDETNAITERTDAIPVALKKLRLTSRWRHELVRNITAQADYMARKRIHADRVALGHAVWLDAVGGEIRAEQIENLPDGWMQRASTFGVAIKRPGKQTLYLNLPLEPARAVPVILRLSSYALQDSDLHERVVVQHGEEQRIDAWCLRLNNILKDAAPSCRNVYALLTLPGVPQYVTPGLVSWCMERLRPDTLPARTFEQVAAIAAQFDNLPPVPLEQEASIPAGDNLPPAPVPAPEEVPAA